MVVEVKGYVADVPYVRAFIRELAPAWLDHVAVISGLVPPEREGGFAWCDLGCGQGVTAIMLAALHPGGQFYGIDAMPEHIDHGRRFADEAGVANVSFHAADFAAAADLPLPKFDYIVAHGVYSWVGPLVRADMRSFIDRHIKHGGLVYISYNAMPGRAADLPFQRLVRAVGETCAGDSTERVSAALKVVDSLLALKAPALVASPMLSLLKAQKSRFAAAYLAHEYMGRHWDPLFVTEVRSEMAEIGLKPVGSATLVENHDSFVLGQAAREALAVIDDEDVRELARDFLIDQFFRRDLFVHGGELLDEHGQRQRLLVTTFALTRGAGKIEYKLRAAAGRLDFDNAVARAIIAGLATGPCRLGAIAERCGAAAQDIVANAMVLCASTQILPVESGRASVAAINAAISRRLGGPEEVPYVALPCGTGLPVNDPMRSLLRGDAGGVECGEWREFLVAHGILPTSHGESA
jgi:SAM-dependent methyltransferase